MTEILHSRNWVLIRRVLLVVIALIIGFQTYSGSLMSLFSGPDPQNDIQITRSEFRPDVGGETPAWIIGFRNDSQRHTYDQIQLEAQYFNDNGELLETDKLVVSQRIRPGEEHIIGSADFKPRGSATRGTLRVLNAQTID